MSRLPFKRKPGWLQKNRALTPKTHAVAELFTHHRLHSVCHEARCPNLHECYSRGVATFLLMGNVCTRTCRFCQIQTNRTPGPVDPEEPKRVAEVSQKLGLRHVVLTSVARDDLPDEGVGHFVSAISECRKYLPRARIEVLTPDFHARADLLTQLQTTPPDIFNHNIETIARLQSDIRPMATYATSLATLQYVKNHFPPTTLTKSGLMVGLGESDHEVLETLADLASHGVDIITIGQYLAPSHSHARLSRYVHPDVFAWYRKQALAMGFQMVFSGPYVRSSYMADHQFDA